VFGSLTAFAAAPTDEIRERRSNRRFLAPQFFQPRLRAKAR